MVTVNYIRTLNIDEPLARIESGGVIRYYHADALGSIIALTDDLGQVKTQYNYSPFGETEILGEPSDNPFQYTGRENDNTGLYYYRARYYSPRLKRFVSEDLIGLFGGDVNYYVYVWNSPLRWIDPWGLWYVDINISLGYWGGGTGGVLITSKGFYLYAGGGIMTPPGGIAMTVSPMDATKGWNIGLQLGNWLGGQIGYSFSKEGNLFVEGGFVTPGVSLTGYYIWGPWEWPWEDHKNKDNCK